MNKTDVKDITIRAGMAATQEKVSPPDLGVAAPETSGNPSGAPNKLTPSTTPYDNASATVVTGKGGLLPDTGQAQPDCPAPKESSLHDGLGSAVGFPAASDKASAGPVGSGHGLSATPIPGAKIAFPSASDTSMKGKDVSSFMPGGK